MENIKISEFYNKIFSDPVIKSELTEKAKKIKNKEDLKKFIKTEIIPLAKENGFNFSEEDLVDYEYETLRKLKAEDLHNVSGGASFKSILMGGGILSALFLSAGLTSGQIADAVIDLQDAKKSGAAMERAIRNSAQQNMQPQTNNPQNGVRTDNADVNNNDDNDNDNNNHNHNIPGNVDINDNNNKNIINDESNNINNEIDNNNNNNTFDDDNVNNNNNDNDVNVPLPKDVVENSIDGNILEAAKNSKADINYFLEACNLLTPFIDCNYSGAVDKLRFENGYTQGITVGAPGGDGVETLEFNKYSGAGITNLMTSMFPSSGGDLNIAGGYPGSYPLYKTCLPTPELMGQIIAYFYNNVRCPDKAHAEAVSKELEGLILYDEYNHFLNIRKNFYDEKGNFKKPKGGYKNYIAYLKEIDDDIVAEVENERNNTRPGKAPLAPPTSSSEEKQHKKGEKVQWQLWDDATAAKLISNFDDKYRNVNKNLTTKHEYLDATKVFLEKNLQLDVDQYIADRSVEDQKIDVYSFAVTLLHLLNEGTYAIRNQEERGDAKSDLENERFLPKYTVEHSTGAFCVHLFNNQQDIDEYYNTIMRLCLATDSDANKDVSESWAKIENYIKFLGTIIKNLNSPYKNATCEHKGAYHVDRDDQGNVSFSNDTFMDCADIASRHIINLISYDKPNQGILLYDGVKIQELSQKFVDKDVPVADLLPPNMQEEEFDSMLDKFVDCSLDLSIDEKLAYLANERLRTWHRIFGEEVLNSKREIIRLITDNVKVIVPAIADHTSIKDLSKKEWLLHFYMHQALDPKGADADDTVTRTFWELVISHMDKDVPDGFFTIKYSKTNKVPGNELEPGFLNSLKLLYNLSYALKSDNPDLKFAETAINALENVCKNPQPDNKSNDETKANDEVKKKTKEEILQDALKATLGLFYPAENLTIEEGFSLKEPTDDENEKKDDCYATVTVIKKITEKEKLSFSIRQDDGHAKVTFEPVVFNELDDDLKNFVETESSLQPFAYKFREKLGLNIDLGNKNYNKFVKPIYWTVFDLRQPQMRRMQFEMGITVPLEVRKTQFFQNYEALRFLRTMQGEAQNTERISREITTGCAEVNIKINNKKKLLSTFIYENYASRCDELPPFDFLGISALRIAFDNNIGSFFKETVELARRVKIIAKDSKGAEYLYTRPRRFTSDNKEVLILPLSFDTLDTWTIPATVKINGEEFTVVGTSSGVCQVKNITLSPGIEKFTFGSAFLSTESINLGNAQNLKSLTFEKNSFSESLLKEVIVPDCVTEMSIEHNAFNSCKSLETFIFPNHVTHLSIGKDSSIDSGAFFNCKNLKQVKLPANLQTLEIGKCTFKDCVSLQEFIIPEGVSELYIGINAFIGCDAFEIIFIPNSVTKLSIPWGALLGYTSSKKVEIPSSVVSLTLECEDSETEKFLNNLYKNNIEIKIPEHIKDLTIAEKAFFFSKLRSFEVSPGIQNVFIDKDAFEKCKLLSKVLINASRLEMAPSGFSGCSELLKKIIGPANVNEDGLRELKSNHIEYMISKNSNIAKFKWWFMSIISNALNGIKSIARWLKFWD